MSNEVPFGRVPTQEGQRDAGHIAWIALRAECDLKPGDFVGKTPNGWELENPAEAVGIVDPFRKPKQVIKAGELFYLLLLPNTVTGMTHHWEHPLFSDNPPKAAAEQLIRDFVANYAPREYGEDTAEEWWYATLLQICKDASEGSHACAYSWEGLNDDIYDFGYSAFWGAIHELTGCDIPDEPPYFSCAC